MLPISSNIAEWNAHFDFRSGAGSGGNLEGSARVARPLAHAEQTQAGLATLGFRIEPDPVVLDCQLHAVALLPQLHRHVAGAGVPLHVGQGFLKNAEERHLDVEGQPLRRIHTVQLDV